MNLSPLFWTLILITISILVFLALGVRAKARLRKQYPPVGQMVDIGGYRLHLHVEGAGIPTVVLDAGAGGIGLSWELVRPAIARVTRVVVYDRAGLGWSDPGPYPRDARTMAQELHTALTNAGIPGPYILAGHSLGGPVARQFAAKYPDEVAGLVMVDSAHEQQVKYFPAPVMKMVSSMKGMLGVMKLISKLGIFALIPGLIQIGDHGKLGRELAAQMQGVMASSKSHAEALIAETESVYGAKTQPVPTLGDIPLAGILGGLILLAAVSMGVMRSRMGDVPSDLDYSTTQPSEQGLFNVSYTASTGTIPINQMHQWTLHVERADGTPVEDATITVDGDMPQHGHGLPTQPRVTQNLGNGDYLVDGLKFQMGGWWLMDFTITAGSETDEVHFNMMLE